VLWNEGKFDGGWCSDAYFGPISWLHSLQDCQKDGYYWWRYNHSGVDVVASGVVKVIADGELFFKQAGYSGYGNVKVFRHSDGMCSLYGHMKSDALWENGVVGYQAKKGDPIGTVGDTGVSGHSHLHLAVYECGMEMPENPALSISQWCPSPITPTTRLLTVKESMVGRLHQIPNCVIVRGRRNPLWVSL